MITLDDQQFQVVGVRQSARRLSRYSGVVLIAGALLPIFLTLLAFIMLFAPTFTQGIFIVLPFMAGFIGQYLIPWMWAGWTLFWVLVVHRIRVARFSHIQVDGLSDILPCVALVERLRSFLLRPAISAAQAYVLAIREDLWQEVVKLLVARADVVMIDVSALTRNIVWEIEHVALNRPHGTVFVADSQQISARLSEDSIAGQLVHTQGVHYYDSGASDRHLRKYRRMLQRACEAAAEELPVRQTSRGVLRQLFSVRVVGLYLAAAVITATAFYYLYEFVVFPRLPWLFEIITHGVLMVAYVVIRLIAWVVSLLRVGS